MRWTKKAKEGEERERSGSSGTESSSHSQLRPQSSHGTLESQSTNANLANVGLKPGQNGPSQPGSLKFMLHEGTKENRIMEDIRETKTSSDKTHQPSLDAESNRSATSCILPIYNTGRRLAFDDHPRISSEHRDGRISPKSQISRARNSDSANHTSAGSGSSSVVSSEATGLGSITSGSSSGCSAGKGGKSSKGFSLGVSMTPKFLTSAHSENNIQNHSELLKNGALSPSSPPYPQRPTSNLTPTLATLPRRTKSIRSVRSFRSAGDTREHSPFRLLAARNRANSIEPDPEREPRKSSFLSLRSRRDSDSIYSSSLSNGRSSRNGTPIVARSPEEEYFNFIMPSMLSDESPRAYLSRIMKEVKQSSLAGILSKRYQF